MVLFGDLGLSTKTHWCFNYQSGVATLTIIHQRLSILDPVEFSCKLLTYVI